MLIAVFTALTFVACGKDAVGTVSIESPANGAQLTSPFVVRMSANDLIVEQAGTARDGYGHHHIIVDAELPPKGQAIPSDSQHLHFGKGQTEAVLDLAPGEHTLRLVFAKGDHVPYDPAVSASVKITVTERRTVTFQEPSDGASVTSPFTVRMGTEGLTLEPAGTVREGFGHHHILVDTELPPVGQPVPSDDQHLDFGKGQMETTLDLPPGEHTLTLLFADGNHIPYDPPITQSIKVIVVE